MMNAVKKTACAVAVLATTSTAVMAESIDVKVIGTITPTACKPTLGGGGTIDYGIINPNTLKKDDFTFLPEKKIDFSLTCDAPAKVALEARSGRGKSAVLRDGSLGDYAMGHLLFGKRYFVAEGLGLDGDKGIGGYALRFVPGSMQADGKNVDVIDRKIGQSAWRENNDGILHRRTQEATQLTWAANGAMEPIAFTTLSGKLGGEAYINKASELNLAKPVKLDGLTTLELVYL